MTKLKQTILISGLIFLAVFMVGIFFIADHIVANQSLQKPLRLTDIVDEADGIIQNLTGQTETIGLITEIKSLIDEADCANTKSLCRTDEAINIGGFFKVYSCGVIDSSSSLVDSLWSAKEKEDDFYAKQEELAEKRHQLAFIQNILKKEMEQSIPKEVKAMKNRGMTEEAEQIEEELGLLLFFLDPNDQETLEVVDDEIINKGMSIMNDLGINWQEESMLHLLDKIISVSPDEAKIKDCGYQCSYDFYFHACIIDTEQAEIDLVFNIKLALKDLQISPIIIDLFKMVLIDEINIPEPRIKFTIPIPDIEITFPNIPANEISAGDTLNTAESDYMSVSSPHIETPSTDSIWIKCPEQNDYTVKSEGSSEIGEIDTTEIKWYFETFSYLAQRCNTLKSTKSNPYTPECFSFDGVISEISSTCSNAFYCYPDDVGGCGCNISNCGFCLQIGVCGTGTFGFCSCCAGVTVAQASACETLYTSRGKPVPLLCIEPDAEEVNPWTFNPLQALEDKCFIILEEEKQKEDEDKIEIPHECALTAYWKNQLDLYAEDYEEIMKGDPIEVEEGTEVALPKTFIGCDPPDIPTIPKIELSKYNVEIPNITTPTLNMCPIVEVKLPDVIIEDLEFPDIELCNLQDCQDLLDMMPSFIDSLPGIGRFFIPIPDLYTSPININPIDIDIDGVGTVQARIPNIQIDPIKHPSLAFDMPQMPEINPLSLSMPMYEIPSFSFPSPEVTFSFEGIDVDMMSILIGIIFRMLDFSLPSGCIGGNIKIGCLHVRFEDYHISWADFPKIPEIPFCKTAREFCRNTETNIKDVIEGANEIAEKMQNAIQQELNIPSEKMQEIMEAVNSIVKDKEEEINNLLGSSTFTGSAEGGIVKINPIIISVDDIDIDISLTDIANIPTTINIDWESMNIPSEISLADPIKIEMPTIPLSDISVEKKLVIKIPFIQLKGIPFMAEMGSSTCEGDKGMGSPFEVEKINTLQESFNKQTGKMQEMIKNINSLIKK